jgi:ketopantoate reductase
MKRIAVIGLGAIGGTVIVRLAQMKELQITICARSAVSRLRWKLPRES